VPITGWGLVISEPLAGRVYLLNQQQLPRKAAIDTALMSFANSAEGKAYFAKYKLEGYRPLRPKELENMDIYSAEVRHTLK